MHNVRHTYRLKRKGMRMPPSTFFHELVAIALAVLVAALLAAMAFFSFSSIG